MRDVFQAMLMEHRPRLSFLLVLGLILLPVLIPQVRAAGIDVTVSQSSITVNMRLQLVENLTSLPSFKTFLDSSNSSVVFEPMQKAAIRLVTGVQITGMTGSIGIRLLDVSLGLQLLEENYTLTILGASTNLGGLIKSDLAFLSMKVSDPVNVKGEEINQIGISDLLQPLRNLPTTSSTNYFINGGTYLNTVIPGNAVAGFYLLDFSWVPAVSRWSHQYELFGNSIWTLQPSSPFNLTIGVRQIENVFVPLYMATYTSSIELTAPQGAWSEGVVVSFNIPAATDVAMPLIVIGSLATLLTSFFLDRKLTRQARTRRKK